jgi:hypothetical protein
MPFSTTDLKTSIATIIDPLKGVGEILVTQDAALRRDFVDKIGRWTGFHFTALSTGTPTLGQISFNGNDPASASAITITLSTWDLFQSLMDEVIGTLALGSKLILRTHNGFQFAYGITAKAIDGSLRITYTLSPISTNSQASPYTVVDGESVVISYVSVAPIIVDHFSMTEFSRTEALAIYPDGRNFFVVPANMAAKKLKSVKFAVPTAPTGVEVIGDLRKNGASVANFEMFDGQTIKNINGLDITLAENDIFDVVISQVGGTTTGFGLNAIARVE